MRIMFCLAVVAGLMAGCSSSGVEQPPATPMEYGMVAGAVARDALTESLFKDDQKVIGNEEMARILDARVELPKSAKIAVIRFGQMPYWWGWSEDFVRVSEKLDREFLDTLRASPRLREVSYLPSLVTPMHLTIPHLRQAAARFQADLILVYRTSSRSYDRQKFLRRDEARAYCTVEAVLIDTRTGIIPFSTVITEHYAAKRGSDDMELAEMVARTEQRTIANAWKRVAEETVAFLRTVDGGKDGTTDAHK